MNGVRGKWESCWREDDGFYTLVVCCNGDYLEISGFTLDEICGVFESMDRRFNVEIEFFGEEAE